MTDRRRFTADSAARDQHPVERPARNDPDEPRGVDSGSDGPSTNADAQVEHPTSVEPGVWRYEMATRAHVIVDAADYFALMQQAMMDAKCRILMIGWDFDTRIKLGRPRRWRHRRRRGEPPHRLGRFILWLVKRNPDLEVRVLKWNFGAFKAIFRGTMLFDLWRWMRHPRIRLRFDSAHPIGCSHHQKVVIIDDRLAVCGGIDMTADRWDTRNHLDRDPHRRRPSGRRYGPWHDATMMVEGDVAQALDDLGRERWEIAGGERLQPCGRQERTAWPDGVATVHFTDVEVGISRNRAQYGEIAEIREVEALFLRLIGQAKRFIYAETQYFASRRIAEAIARRMAEPDPPEIVLINPLHADGWLEQQAMDGARVRLLRAIGRKDAKNRFRVYNPYTAGGTPIYVHAKLMIVDDEVLRIGSANMNNRSLGLDSECDLLIDSNRPANLHCRDAIARLRYSLLAEHCGLEPEEVPALLDRYGSMHEMIARHPMPGRRLQPYELPVLGDIKISMADNEFLDPESPAEIFEPVSRRRGLFSGRTLRPPR